jgi:hypothetical protein
LKLSSVAPVPELIFERTGAAAAAADRDRADIEGRQECGGRGVIAHQRHKVDQRAGAELVEGAGVGLRRHSACGEDFTGEVDNDCIWFGEGGGGAAPADYIDNLG